MFCSVTLPQKADLPKVKKLHKKNCTGIGKKVKKMSPRHLSCQALPGYGEFCDI
jgi:hypothetical protein